MDLHKDFEVDNIISKILNVGTPGCSLIKTVRESEIFKLCEIATKIFKEGTTMVEIGPPVRICGDTHGQFSDVLRLLDRGGFPPYSNYLFLGDYVDRGQQSLEVILLFLAFKVKFPHNFFILRGNHECSAINRAYGFYEECIRRYNSPKIWLAFQTVFTQMPLVGLVGGRILCMHGGLSQELKSLTKLRELKRVIDPEPGSLESDLLWADPDATAAGFRPNTRGVSSVFGPDVVRKALKKHNLDLVVRAHQVVQDGYEFFANKKLVTIFSAPHYCGQFDNAGAMMVVDERMVCSFHVIRPTAMKVVKAK